MSKALSDRFHADIGTDVLCVDREFIYARTGKKPWDSLPLFVFASKSLKCAFTYTTQITTEVQIVISHRLIITAKWHFTG